MAAFREHPYTLRGSPGAALFGATVGFFIGFGAVSLFGPTTDKFIEAMQLSPFEVGLLVSTPMLTGSLLRIPFGAWVDSTGGKLPFLILLILSVIGIAGLYWMLLTLYPEDLNGEHYPLLLLFGALGGCGIATFTVGIGQVSYWYPRQNQGWALAAYAGFGNTSPGLVAIALPLIIALWGLWSAYLISLVIVVGGIVLYATLGHNAWYFQLRKRGASAEEAKRVAAEHGQEYFPQESAARTLAAAARIWRTWALVLLYFTTFGGFLALTTWLPTYWQQHFELSKWYAVGLTAGFSLFASLIRVPGGSLADRAGGERVAFASLGLLVVASAVVSFSAMPWLAAIGMFLIAAGMGVNNAAVFRMVPNYVPDAVGGASGWVGGLGALGGFVIPPVMGQTVEWLGPAGYERGYLVFVLLALLSLGLTGLLRRTSVASAG